MKNFTYTTLMTLTFCLFALTGCQKDVTITPMVDAESNDLIQALSSSTVNQNTAIAQTIDGSGAGNGISKPDLQATIVARRKDGNPNFSQMFEDNRDCQAICQGEGGYFGLIEMPPRYATTINGTSCNLTDCSPNICIQLRNPRACCGTMCWWAWLTRQIIITYRR